MFEKILGLLNSGAPMRLSVVAKELDMSESMLQQMILELLRMGYLEERAIEAAPSCSSGCGSCSGCGTTSSLGEDGRKYHITAKGVRKLSKD